MAQTLNLKSAIVCIQEAEREYSRADKRSLEEARTLLQAARIDLFNAIQDVDLALAQQEVR